MTINLDGPTKTSTILENGEGLFLSSKNSFSQPLAQIRKQKPNGTSLIVLPKYEPLPRTQEIYKWHIVWRNVIAFIYMHTFLVYALYLVFTLKCNLNTGLWAIGLGFVSGQGITAGAHRLWAHRTYKAKLPLRIFLATLQTISFQNHIYEWVRDHRVHHKFTDTNADPHNVTRGFFFSHIGWLLIKKHRDVFIKGKAVDLSDLRQDPVVMFQKKYFLLLMPLLSFVFPVVVPCFFWGEDIWISWYVAGVTRYVISLHATWTVNSLAHIWGTKPYDNSIGPTENIFVAVVAFGEGWHNYHHVFPWDYKTAELGNYKLNMSTAFIDFMAYIGQAYDRKTVSIDMINKRSRRTGDGSRIAAHTSTEDEISDQLCTEMIWGWGDKDMKKEDVDTILAYNKLNSD